jgi:hypothetical protein
MEAPAGAVEMRIVAMPGAMSDVGDGIRYD